MKLKSIEMNCNPERKELTFYDFPFDVLHLDKIIISQGFVINISDAKVDHID